MEYKTEINDIYPEYKQYDLYNYLQGLKVSDDAIEELIDELEDNFYGREIT